MKKIYLIISLLLLFLNFGYPSLVSAAEPPFLKMVTLNLWSGISTQNGFNQLVTANPLYTFSNPFTETAVVTPSQIEQLHSRLPQTKVILHLTCCTMFNPEEVDSSVAKVHADLQNTQAEFNNAWVNHQNAFMKNNAGGFVYFKIEKVGNSWVYEGDGYLMDPASSFYQDFLYNKIKYHVTTGGFDGAYLDLMYPNFMKYFYYSVPAVNGSDISRDQWNSKLISLSRYLQNRRQNDPDPKMRNALIITNSVGGGPGDSSDPFDRIQFNRDLQTQGVQIENPFANYRSMSTANWLGIVNRIRDITALRNNQMRGWLNYHTGDYTYANEQECNDHGLFAYSSYLLGNQSLFFAFSFECLMGPGIRKEPTQNLTHVRLGPAPNPYQQLSSGIYLREFENGFALVNPTAGSLTYKPSINLKDAYSTTAYPKNTNITLPAKTGLVLLKDTSVPTANPADLNQDGKVDVYDYNLLVTDFGKTGTPGWIKADIIKNGKVDIYDYNALVGSFGQ